MPDMLNNDNSLRMGLSRGFQTHSVPLGATRLLVFVVTVIVKLFV